MLTALEVKNAKPKEKPYKLTDGHGLFLYVAPSGKKTWRYRFVIAGTESTFVLGEYPVLSLEKARIERALAREMVKAGKNPSEERRSKKNEDQRSKKIEQVKIENSFTAVALEWHQNQRDRWAKGHAQAILTTLERDVFPAIGDTQIDQITPPMILQILRTIEARGALVIASKVLQRITAVFRYAVQTGRATYNPASEMRGVVKARKVQHHPMIQPDELPDFLRNLTTADIHTTTKLAIQFTILTAARSGEVRGATWSEIDLEKNLWSIPAKRMKMQMPHTIPLSLAAISILNRVKLLYGDSLYVFPGIHFPNGPLSENTMLFAMYRMGYHSKATMHGFRALFSTIANEAGFHPDAIERQLAHREKNAVRAAYHRSEYLPERMKMMGWWADHLRHLEHGAEIIPIGRKTIAEK
jgi:integrase